MARDFHPEDYVGLRYAEAHALAADRGWTPRRVVPGQVITAEYNNDRLNLWPDEDDIVVDASLG